MINNFVSNARRDGRQRLSGSSGSPTHETSEIERLKIENQRSKQRLENLRREIKSNIGINDLKKEREHVKNLIMKTDERIDRLVKELRKTEPKTQDLLNVAEKERELAEAAILHVSSSDPAAALEQERLCEKLKQELHRVKQINNENLKNEVKNAERREEIIKQVQQENQSRQRLALMLDSLNQKPRPPLRSQTFSDTRQHMTKSPDLENKVISLINLSENSTDRNALAAPYNLLPHQVPRHAEESNQSINSHNASNGFNRY